MSLYIANKSGTGIDFYSDSAFIAEGIVHRIPGKIEECEIGGYPCLLGIPGLAASGRIFCKVAAKTSLDPDLPPIEMLDIVLTKLDKAILKNREILSPGSPNDSDFWTYDILLAFRGCIYMGGNGCIEAMGDFLAVGAGSQMAEALNIAGVDPKRIIEIISPLTQTVALPVQKLTLPSI